MLFLLLNLWNFQGEDAFEKGRKILMTEGPVKAHSYFENLLDEQDDPKSLYYVGWSLWSDGKPGEAQWIAEYLIDRVQNDQILGHSYYLLGLIETDRLNPESVSHFDSAIDHYKKIEANSSLYRSYCAKAASLIFQSKFAEAHDNLSKAMVYRAKSKKPNDLAYYYELISRVFFEKKEFDAALEAAKASHKGYLENKDPISSTHALSSISFYEILSGQAETGVERIKTVDKLIEEGGDKYRKLSFYHAINWILVLRCAGEDYSSFLSEVNRYLDITEDFFLEKLLSFSLNWNCGRPEN